MIIRVVRLFVVLLASALLGTGCSVHDSARTMADAEHAGWGGGERRTDGLSHGLYIVNCLYRCDEW
jgi:hypothetical protein